MPIIEVKNLTKKFPLPGKKGDLLAVNDVSFEVAEGEVFGLLGPNGAGKTTTLEIIEGLQRPTAGEAYVKGLNVQKETSKVKEIIGVQLQSSAYFDYLKLDEILELFGSFYKKRVDPDRLLATVDLIEKKKSLTKELSGGQQQRFSICSSLVNDPEIAFLDEPTTGLDPQARRLMWEFIKKTNQEGRTIVLTTHYMEEAQLLCHRVGIMDQGKIIALDTPSNLIDQLKSSGRIDFRTEDNFDLESLKKLEGILNVTKKNNHSYHLEATHTAEALTPLYTWAHNNKIEIQDLEVTHANLEDVFLALTGKELRE